MSENKFQVGDIVRFLPRKGYAAQEGAEAVVRGYTAPRWGGPYLAVEWDRNDTRNGGQQDGGYHQTDFAPAEIKPGRRVRIATTDDDKDSGKTGTVKFHDGTTVYPWRVEFGGGDFSYFDTDDMRPVADRKVVPDAPPSSGDECNCPSCQLDGPVPTAAAGGEESTESGEYIVVDDGGAILTYHGSYDEALGDAEESGDDFTIYKLVHERTTISTTTDKVYL